MRGRGCPMTWDDLQFPPEPDPWEEDDELYG
jgi:hypothetical protein